MSLLLSAMVLAAAAYFYMMLKLPAVDELKDMRLQEPLRIYTNDGKLIAEYGAMRREPVSLNQIPKPLIDAVIATEDQRFFQHSGVDFISIVRAAREVLATGQKTQGASTITMQVARNFYLSREKTYSRKINEILLALKINSTFSKEKILELYLNRIYLGQRAYGVAAAASIYYGKSLNQLTLAEMATIAGLPQAPSRENPITNPAAAKDRRNHVLQRMRELGYIDKASYEQAIAEPIETHYYGAKIEVAAPYIAEMVRNVIYQQFGEEGYTSGLSVYTTIDSRLQAEANAAVRNGLIDYERRKKFYRGAERNLSKLPQNEWQRELADMPSENGLLPAALVKTGAEATAMLATGNLITLTSSGTAWARQFQTGRALKRGDVIRVLQQNNREWQIAQIPKVEGALVSISPNNGAIMALVGGFRTSDSMGFNRAVQAKRQPGSNFKPFIYAAALSKGFTLATVINDAPIAINDTGNPNNLWRPQNDQKMFFGPTRLRIGLIKSINVMTIRVLQRIGIPYAINYVSGFGFDRSSLPPSLSMALGTGEVTPLQLIAGYAVFANGGYRVPPYFIASIKTEAGKEIYQAHPATVPAASPLTGAVSIGMLTTPVPLRVIDADVAYLMTNALMTVIQYGSGNAASVLNRKDIAGKTGTTQRQVDAWFSGFNSDVATTVWVGYDQPQPLHEYGSRAALPIWVDFMRVALEGKPEATLPPPDDIVTVRINRRTGFLASPDDEDSTFEVFRADNVPTEETSGNVPDDQYIEDYANPNMNEDEDPQMFQ